MASIPAQKPAPQSHSVEERFRRLAAIWENETGHLSSMSAANSHPAYQEIISLGPEVVPFLLRDLETNETHWFGALRQITGANPIPSASSGNVPLMVQAWLLWARENGYQW